MMWSTRGTETPPRSRKNGKNFSHLSVITLPNHPRFSVGRPLVGPKLLKTNLLTVLGFLPLSNPSGSSRAAVWVCRL